VRYQFSPSRFIKSTIGGAGIGLVLAAVVYPHAPRGGEAEYGRDFFSAIRDNGDDLRLVPAAPLYSSNDRVVQDGLSFDTRKLVPAGSNLRSDRRIFSGEVSRARPCAISRTAPHLCNGRSPLRPRCLRYKSVAGETCVDLATRNRHSRNDRRARLTTHLMVQILGVPAGRELCRCVAVVFSLGGVPASSARVESSVAHRPDAHIRRSSRTGSGWVLHIRSAKVPSGSVHQCSVD
jgi:hypothetical protein